ncbi:MAG: exodeoxyribonuclease V alpha subunit [Oleispira sp.]|jgi:exodeoxyribonuclease V alpha subunit
MTNVLNIESPKNLKSWLKSTFEKSLGQAIDLELATGLCLNEIALTVKEKAHDEASLKLYAYLVIKLSQALSRGEVCIELSHVYDLSQKTGVLNKNLDAYLQRYATLHTISLADGAESLKQLSETNPYDLVVNYPLVVMQGRLYFSRYWFYQQQVFYSISTRLHSVSDQTQVQIQTETEAKTKELSNTLQTLFVQDAKKETAQPDWQMIAAANACLNRFSVITGGPGTGKTTTVTRLLAALISQQPNLRIALAAPTGKAAARLVESILAAKAKLAQTFPLAAKIPVTSFTLHRLLGWRPDGFSYNHKKTLPYDLVIVDEASMVDLPMMAQLMEALATNTRLILLGDKDQLASVEAGSVLGDLCDSGVMVNGYHAHGLQGERAKQLEALCGMEQGYLNDYIETNAPLMANSLTQLRVSHRFTHDSGIGKLAAAVNAGQFSQVQQSFTQYDDIHCYTNLAAPFSKDLTIQTREAEFAWQQQVINGYSQYLQAIEQGESPYQVLQLFNKFQLLCALRQGSSGLQALNDRVQSLLQNRGLLNIDNHQGSGFNNSSEQSRWYVGRPVMISRNDYELNLFNGDIGIAMMVESKVGGIAEGMADGKKGKKELRVCFATEDTSANSSADPSAHAQPNVRQLLPTRLPSHETAFAMTVHKSQGSEFADVALVLPDNHSPVISRELIYTAITRAKKSFSLYSNDEVLAAGVNSQIERASGLRDLLFK